MADKRRPTPSRRPTLPPRPREGDDVRKGGGGWQKPVQRPTQDSRPDGLPPKKPS